MSERTNEWMSQTVGTRILMTDLGSIVPCFSKCGSQPSSISILWELVRHAGPQAHLSLLDQNLYFNKIFRQSMQCFKVWEDLSRVCLENCEFSQIDARQCMWLAGKQWTGSQPLPISRYWGVCKDFMLYTTHGPHVAGWLWVSYRTIILGHFWTSGASVWSVLNPSLEIDTLYATQEAVQTIA